MTIDEASERPGAAPDLPAATGARAGGPADRTAAAEMERLFAGAEANFAHYEVLKDLVDELIDLSLDYRQSGHPGGSRSKVHMLLALLLSGAMRWDIRRPWLRFADRFVLSAGHTVPLVYATLAVLNEGLRARAERPGSGGATPGDAPFAFPDDGRFALTWEHLLGLRHRGGLPGHAEMAGRTLFFKANTGPSGHGMPFAAGEAMALISAGAGEVKVFTVEGEGGLTPGAAHETKNSAWGLGLHNLVFLLDWNDYGIDERPASAVVHGTPADWFGPYGWRVTGAEHGMEWGPVTRAVLDAARGPNPDNTPSVAWFKTRKGRGYGKLDAASHGTPHKQHSPEFWAARREFMARYGVEYKGAGDPAPADAAAFRAQTEANFQTAIGVLRRDESLVTWLSDRLLEIAASVPEEIDGFRLGRHTSLPTGAGQPATDRQAARPVPTGPTCDSSLFDFERYPAEMWRAPGDRQPNRSGLATWGSYVNAISRRDYGRPLFIACSADLAESTNIAGFAKPFGDLPGFGWYERDANPTGALLPQEITEFTNAGMMAGLASVNFAEDPFKDFDGFWGATSTYGSFSYLKYGPLRLFSQLAQDCDLRVGNVLYVAGHSGPETAEDSRTHFGVFSPGVTQLFPEGHVLDLHPWEYNEVPVVLAAACATDVPIIALHLTRPPVEIPDRAALGMPSHFAAARGAYVMRPFRHGASKAGTVFVRGSISTANLVKVLPELDRRGLNVKVVAAISPQLFALQDAAYRAATVEPADSLDSMVITNGAYKLMRDWADDPIVRDYSLSSDWDDRWRTGGSVDDVMEEAHLDAGHILEAIERFALERPDRLRRLRERQDAVESRN